MNTTPFMDKQIMDLTYDSSSHNHQTKDFIDLIKTQNDDVQQHHEIEETKQNQINKNDIVPSYDFQPIRPLSASNYNSAPNLDTTFSNPRWNSSDHSNSNPIPNSSNPVIKSYSSLDSIEPAKVIAEKDQNAFESTILSEIDRTMRKHTDNLLHVLEGLSARLTQLESRTHRFENIVDDLKVTVGNNHGSTDGKLRQLENILREVQTGVQTMKDKQDIVEAQLQLAKLQVSAETDKPSDTQTSAIPDPLQQAASAPLQSQQHFPSILNAAPQLPSQQGLPPPVFPQNQIPAAPQRDPYFPQQVPPVPSQETVNQQYQLPLSQQPHPQPGAPPPNQQYQQTPHSQYPPQPPLHLPQQQPSHSPINPPQLQSSLGGHIVEEPTPYVTSQNYPPNLRQPPSQLPSGPPPSQQFYGAPPPPHHVAYEPPSSRPGSGFSSGYGTVSGPADQYRYGGSGQYGGSSAPKQQLPTASSGGTGYPQLPTARVLPQALPTASTASSAPGSPGAGNRVSIDDVVDKVASMGFPRDYVRATVRKLTDNGQSVDLNAVLDKLMTEGENQPTRGWFGGR
ncbi:PREDICTED: bromodomain-containing protein 4-like isoform X2 [Lupinus angustifolius]|uniref:bromodomain-containing protein 4-like isoform X2 n=1 Tax=Lupinus angustifolius TaxID=3871 RepID=UPI00092E4AD9|nr:PREDICTED: bromodomain-containing protein 4-like isoform X2 [Lupinus angustifolius]